MVIQRHLQYPQRWWNMGLPLWPRNKETVFYSAFQGRNHWRNHVNEAGALERSGSNFFNEDRASHLSVLGHTSYSKCWMVHQWLSFWSSHTTWRSQHPNFKREYFLLHHINAPMQMAARTLDFLKKEKVWVLLYPSPYSPDQAQCDFFLFLKTKEKNLWTSSYQMKTPLQHTTVHHVTSRKKFE